MSSVSIALTYYSHSSVYASTYVACNPKTPRYLFYSKHSRKETFSSI